MSEDTAAAVRAGAVALREDARELGAEEEDLRGVVHPNDEDHQRSCRPVRRADAGFAEIEADQKFSDGEEQRGHRSADRDVSPVDSDIRDEFVKEGEQDADREKGHHGAAHLERGP